MRTTISRNYVVIKTASKYSYKEHAIKKSLYFWGIKQMTHLK